MLISTFSLFSSSIIIIIFVHCTHRTFLSVTYHNCNRRAVFFFAQRGIWPTFKFMCARTSPLTISTTSKTTRCIILIYASKWNLKIAFYQQIISISIEILYFKNVWEIFIVVTNEHIWISRKFHKYFLLLNFWQSQKFDNLFLQSHIKAIKFRH